MTWKIFFLHFSSIKFCRCEDPLSIAIPIVLVMLRYCTICFTSIHVHIINFCCKYSVWSKYSTTIFTAYRISGYIPIAGHSNPPTILHCGIPCHWRPPVSGCVCCEPMDGKSHIYSEGERWCVVWAEVMFNVLQEKNSEANGCSKPQHLSSMDPAMRNEGIVRIPGGYTYLIHK